MFPRIAFPLATLLLLSLSQLSVGQAGMKWKIHDPNRPVPPVIDPGTASTQDKYPAAWPARVTLALRNGSALGGTSDYPRGNPENPVSTGELENKFLALVESRFGRDTALAALQAVQRLNGCEDMAERFRDILPAMQ